MIWRIIWITLLCAAVLSGCAYLNTTRQSHAKSYTVNIEEQSSVGVTMLSSQSMSYVRGTHKYGLAEEQQKWESREYPTRDAYREELIYRGRSGDILHFTYKEYRNVLSSPAFSQEINFDIGSSDIITFKNYEIKVLNATSEYIRFKVISD
jgi:hypothetical protein